jgi:pyridoxamine 5'-phosphate oxidase
MAKPAHLAAHPALELAWWFEQPNTQFRITGKGVTIPAPSVESKESIEKKLKSIGAKSEEELGDWWEKERKRVWEGVSGHLRAGFARPPPGSKLEDADRKPEDWPETIPTSSVCQTNPKRSYSRTRNTPNSENV